MQLFSTIINKLKQIKLVPVIKIEDKSMAVPLARALIAGGLPCAEITCRTAAAASSIKLITEAFPDMLVGAGTVITKSQVDQVINAGAQFIVSPGINPEVVAYCIEEGIPIIPGCITPSEIEQAIALGLDVVKFFPAEAAGGLAMIKALSAPYGDIHFMPTGGITLENMNNYLVFPKVLACGASFMANEELLSRGDFIRIEELTRQAVSAINDRKKG